MVLRMLSVGPGAGHRLYACTRQRDKPRLDLHSPRDGCIPGWCTASGRRRLPLGAHSKSPERRLPLGQHFKSLPETGNLELILFAPAKSQELTTRRHACRYPERRDPVYLQLCDRPTNARFTRAGHSFRVPTARPALRPSGGGRWGSPSLMPARM